MSVIKLHNEALVAAERELKEFLEKNPKFKPAQAKITAALDKLGPGKTKESRLNRCTMIQHLMMASVQELQQALDNYGKYVAEKRLMYEEDQYGEKETEEETT